eukprot:gnl/Chilomastix_caulleri/2157.p2 GENE.gnl/Chilomastix_caulleri/2157~~gnl/Chilomastix_caulleri/2157.p2  ORF type:complete len:194 (-),score=76.10 gnl/Chilomastix_caulleri/2157:157-738(-)
MCVCAWAWAWIWLWLWLWEWKWGKMAVDGTPIVVSPTFVGTDVVGIPISPKFSPGSLSLLCDLPTPFALPIRSLTCMFGDIICSIDSVLETLDNTQALEDEVEEYKGLMRLIKTKHRTSEAREMSVSLAKERRQQGASSMSLSERVASALAATPQIPVITVSLDKLFEEAGEIETADAIGRKVSCGVGGGTRD